jgi:hypothetical protein
MYFVVAIMQLSKILNNLIVLTLPLQLSIHNYLNGLLNLSLSFILLKLMKMKSELPHLTLINLK